MRGWFIAVLGSVLASAACGTSEMAPDMEPGSDGDLEYEVGEAGDLVGTVVMPSGERVRVGSSADQTARTTRVVGEDGTVHLDWEMNLEDDEIIGAMGGQSFGRFEDYETDEDLALWRSIADSETGQVLEAVSSAAGAELAAASYPAAGLASLEALAAASSYLEDMASPPDPTLDAEGDVACGCDAECEARGDCCDPGTCAAYQCTPGDPSCDHLCGDDQFQCEDGTCIPAAMECDGALDCSLGDDEDWCEESARVSAPAVGGEKAACDDPDAAQGAYRAGRCGQEFYPLVGQNYRRGVFLCEHHLNAHNGPTYTKPDPEDDENDIAVCKSRYSSKVESGRGRLLAKDSDYRGYSNAWATITTSKVPCVRMKFWSTYRRARWRRKCSNPCPFN